MPAESVDSQPTHFETASSSQVIVPYDELAAGLGELISEFAAGDTPSVKLGMDDLKRVLSKRGHDSSMQHEAEESAGFAEVPECNDSEPGGVASWPEGKDDSPVASGASADDEDDDGANAVPPGFVEDVESDDGDEGEPSVKDLLLQVDSDSDEDDSPLPWPTFEILSLFNGIFNV